MEGDCEEVIVGSDPTMVLALAVRGLGRIQVDCAVRILDACEAGADMDPHGGAGSVDEHEQSDTGPDPGHGSTDGSFAAHQWVL
ncbi:hypothetical protein L1887_05119 [Cichorium endivia]|nr:hypothetical protein L1887_05119 [Cichorium endivia]